MKINQNIKNLTSLWEKASRYNNSLTSSAAFNYATMENRKWPNRLWFHADLDEDAVLKAKIQVISSYPNLVIPYWDIYGNNSSRFLEQNGFVKHFEQIGMCLEMYKPFEIQGNIDIKLIVTEDDAILWSKLFTASFGYEIHPDILINTHENINYYVVYYQGGAIGTAITYQTGNITGFHSIGIIPEGRRKGLADELMKVLLNISIEKKSEYATLQASAMGRDLYIKLGFEEQFLIKNYALDSNYLG